MASVEVEFSGGAPVDATINGKRVSGAAAIFLALNETGGRHGVGRADALEDKAVGLKSREAYECPAAMILLAAHRQLESLTLTTRELEAKAQSDALWARLVREGGWYTRLRRSLDAFTDELERPVEGSVSLELYRGSIIVRGRKSRRALYDSRLSSRDSKGVFSQKEARQFAKLYGLQDVMAYMVDSD
jgi:argininosuccinate synthase